MHNIGCQAPVGPLNFQSSIIWSGSQLPCNLHTLCCVRRAAYVWLNSPAVREAIHAEPVDKIGEWTICSDKIFYVSSGLC
jgi:hypothetical protein